MLAANSGRVTNLTRVTYIVMDEADRMFDLGKCIILYYSILFYRYAESTWSQSGSADCSILHSILWLSIFLVAWARLYSSLCRSVGLSVSLCFFRTVGHYCSCPIARDCSAVYPALLFERSWFETGTGEFRIETNGCNVDWVAWLDEWWLELCRPRGSKRNRYYAQLLIFLDCLTLSSR